MGDSAVERWDRSRASDLVALCDAALPGENLSEDELVSCIWDGDDPSVVFGLADGRGAAAAVVRPDSGGPIGFVQLLAVAPETRRQGNGRALVDAVADWAFREQAATILRAGGAAPWYLWPGVDAHATSALCLFESAGFRSRGAALNLSFSSRHRAPVPEGVVLRRVLSEQDASATIEFVRRHWPRWVAECQRAIEQGGCHMACSAGGDDRVLGFGCHSVNRLGWLGPMGTDPERRHGGVGNALLGAIATDLMAAGLPSVEVSWIGPVGFYAKAAAATVSRVFLTYELTPPG